MASYYLLLSLFILLPLLLFLKSISKSFSEKHKHRLPPGPWKLPVIGSVHHFIGRGLPHHALRDLSRIYGGLMFLQLRERPTVIVSSREGAKEIMQTHDLKFCDRPTNNALKLIDYVSKDIVFTPYGELWRELKKVAIQGLLNSRWVQSFRSICEEEINSMIKHISPLSTTKEFLNLSDILLNLVNDVILRAVTGKKSKEKKKLFLREILNAVEFNAMFKIANLFLSLHFLSVLSGVVSRAEQCRCCVEQLLGNIIEEHRKKERSDDADDMISALLKLYDEDSWNNRISVDCVIAVIFDTISGGTEPAAMISQWAMAELIKNAEVMKRAQTKIRQHLQGRKNITESDLLDLKIVRLIINETMRLHPPGPLPIPRECRETCNILGYDILKGTTMIINAWDIGRNSFYWEDAEKFIPERFSEVEDGVELDRKDFKFTPFGAGHRTCPGALFGFSIMELALTNLLYHFDWELPDGMSPDE